ncbi:acyloxyacyl hydrolase [Mitsuokella sp. WILCCON 0060]|uniref:acyloxyacyl hydrolase n=1 Tax=Mitsuokella sp. WILCCON 0060 TaxID=3345341 RepID=UPI003F1BEE5F
MKKQDSYSKYNKYKKGLFLLPAAALGLMAWQAPLVSAASVTSAEQAQNVHVEAVQNQTQSAAALKTEQQAKTADSAAGAEAGNAGGQTEKAKPVPIMKRVQALDAAKASQAEKRHADGNIEVQLEYLDGRFFKKRNVDLYNVHVYKQYRELGALSLHYGLTFERALGYTTEDDIYRDAEAVGFGPSYMLRWTKHVSGKLDASLDATGSVLAYNHAHPGNGRAFGFLWRIGPRLTYNYTDRDALSLAYLFHHSSNGFSTHNPGYNGVGFSLGFTHWY